MKIERTKSEGVTGVDLGGGGGGGGGFEPAFRTGHTFCIPTA